MEDLKQELNDLADLSNYELMDKIEEQAAALLSLQERYNAQAGALEKIKTIASERYDSREELDLIQGLAEQALTQLKAKEA